jgi:L-2-hydroxyglutarate oxidase
VLAFGREAYQRTDFNLRDFFETVTFPGFWRLSARHWRMGLEEMTRSVRKKLFLEALRKFCPELQLHDLVPGPAGIRAQAVRPNGELEDDFQLLHQDNVTNVLNAPSPAATASLAIGEEIVKRAGLIR